MLLEDFSKLERSCSVFLQENTMVSPLDPGLATKVFGFPVQNDNKEATR